MYVFLMNVLKNEFVNNKIVKSLMFRTSYICNLGTLVYYRFKGQY